MTEDKIQYTRMPRWLKVGLIVTIALIAVAAAVLLLGGDAPGGQHGPGRH